MRGRGSLICFSHPELLIFLFLLLSGKYCSPDTLIKKKKGGSHKRRAYQSISHSSRAESKTKIWDLECVYRYSWGKAGAILSPQYAFEAPLPVGAPDSRSSRAQSSSTWTGHTEEHGLRPICRTPPGSLPHNGSAAHRTPGSGYRLPASSLQVL